MSASAAWAQRVRTLGTYAIRRAASGGEPTSYQDINAPPVINTAHAVDMFGVGERAIPPVLEALKRLAPLPAVASRLVTLLSDEDTNFQRVAAVLDTDAALVAEVLRLANSPLIGLSRRVSTTLQALAVLGLRRVYSLIVTLTLCRFLRIAADAQPAIRLCWRHNLATA